ncbi:MAG TPA: PAS domain S-box protein, partial [Dehalococcoidia bacterium]|nr:PAS domain S-box protein [Dehalococcoidia bacterium]
MPNSKTKTRGGVSLSLGPGRPLLFAAGVGAFFWVLDAVGDALVFGRASLREQLLGPEPREVWVRALFFGLLMAVTVYAEISIRRRRRAGEERQQALSLLQATLESTADGILVVDLEGRIQSFNRKFVEMWRIPDAIVASADDDRALAFVLGQLKEPGGFLAKVRELYSQPEAESYDVLEFLDGRLFERYSQPQRVGGRCVGRVWSFRDVTAWRQAEQAQRAHQELLRRLLDGLPIAVGLLSTDGTILEVNRAALRAGGLEREELLGKPFAESYWWAYCPNVGAQIREAVRWAGQGCTVRFDAVGRVRDDRRRAVDLSVQPLLDEAGRITYLVASAMDISERKRAEDALRASEEKYRDLVENLNEIIYVQDRTGVVTYVSPAVQQIGGYTPEEVIGKRFVEFIHPDDLTMVVESFRRTISGAPEPLEYRAVTKEGEVRWVRSYSRLIYDGDEIGGLQGILVDISESRRAEEALR